MKKQNDPNLGNGSAFSHVIFEWICLYVYTSCDGMNRDI